jgi:hypothetical protein
MLSWSWRSIKLLLLHLVGVPYYFTYNEIWGYKISITQQTSNGILLGKEQKIVYKELIVARTWCTCFSLKWKRPFVNIKMCINSKPSPNLLFFGIWLLKCFNRKLLVQQRQPLMASVVGSSGTSVLNFIVSFHSGNHWIEGALRGKFGPRQTKELGY